MDNSNTDNQSTLERTIAFVFAPNESAASSIEPAARVARDAHAPAIFILADLSCADQAVDAVRELQRKGRTIIQAAELDFETSYGSADGLAGRHLEELPRNVLEVLRALAESVLDVYESILVIDATQPIPTVEELYSLMNKLVVSPVEGEAFERLSAEPSPYVMAREYLDTLV